MGKGYDNSNYCRDPPADSRGAKGWESCTPPASAASWLGRGRARSPNPELGWPSLLPRRVPRRDEGSRGTGLVQPRAAEKLLRAQPASGLGGGKSRAASTPVGGRAGGGGGGCWE